MQFLLLNCLKSNSNFGFYSVVRHAYVRSFARSTFFGSLCSFVIYGVSVSSVISFVALAVLTWHKTNLPIWALIWQACSMEHAAENAKLAPLPTRNTLAYILPDSRLLYCKLTLWLLLHMYALSAQSDCLSVCFCFSTHYLACWLYCRQLIMWNLTPAMSCLTFQVLS